MTLLYVWLDSMYHAMYPQLNKGTLHYLNHMAMFNKCIIEIRLSNDPCKLVFICNEDYDEFIVKDFAEMFLTIGIDYEVEVMNCVNK